MICLDNITSGILLYTVHTHTHKDKYVQMPSIRLCKIVLHNMRLMCTLLLQYDKSNDVEFTFDIQCAKQKKSQSTLKPPKQQQRQQQQIE